MLGYFCHSLKASSIGVGWKTGWGGPEPSLFLNNTLIYFTYKFPKKKFKKNNNNSLMHTANTPSSLKWNRPMSQNKSGLKTATAL